MDVISEGSVRSKRDLEGVRGTGAGGGPCAPECRAVGISGRRVGSMQGANSVEMKTPEGSSAEAPPGSLFVRVGRAPFLRVGDGTRRWIAGRARASWVEILSRSQRSGHLLIGNRRSPTGELFGLVAHGRANPKELDR